MFDRFFNQRFKRILPLRRSVDGIMAVLPLGLILSLLPFLLTRETSSLDFPASSVEYVRTVAIQGTDQYEQPSGDVQDVCHPAPLDSDPSDDASGMALHVEPQMRKDSKVLPLPAKAPFVLLILGGEPGPSFADATRRADTAAFSYYQAYPVYLIGDLPPPSA